MQEPAATEKRMELGDSIEGTIFITHRMDHHAGPSGYDRLASTLLAELIYTDSTTAAPPGLLTKFTGFMARRSGTSWYNGASCMSELKAAARWARTRNRIFHFLYGENSYRYFGNIKKIWPRKNKLIATYHTPSWKIRDGYSTTKHLRYLDAIVVVSTSQIDYFSEFVERERIHFVPHGVDTNYFAPRDVPERRHAIKFLTVGEHLRDFESFITVTKTIRKEVPTAQFEVIARPKRVELFRDLPNVTCRSQISDDELREVYRRADVLLLPLSDSTANNSLLEAMSSGLPVISTDLRGIRDYAATDGCILTPRGEVEALTEAVLAVCSGSIDIAKMGKANRMRALDFDWKRVGQQMLRTYEQVLARAT